MSYLLESFRGTYSPFCKALSDSYMMSDVWRRQWIRTDVWRMTKNLKRKAVDSKLQYRLIWEKKRSAFLISILTFFFSDFNSGCDVSGNTSGMLILNLLTVTWVGSMLIGRSDCIKSDVSEEKAGFMLLGRSIRSLRRKNRLHATRKEYQEPRKKNRFHATRKDYQKSRKKKM